MDNQDSALGDAARLMGRKGGKSATGGKKRRKQSHYSAMRDKCQANRDAKNGYRSIDEILILRKPDKLNSPQVEEW